MTGRLLTAALLTAMGVNAAAGKLILDGRTYELTQVYGRKGPDKFDKTKISTCVLAVDPALAAKIDTPEFPEMVNFIQQMQPKIVVVLRATETAKTAELEVSGNGGTDTGTMKLKECNGAWLVMKESWKNR
jgi:hypothetical protein